MQTFLPALYFSTAIPPRPAAGASSGSAGKISREAYVAKGRGQLPQVRAAKNFDESAWTAFAGCLDYVKVDAREAADFTRLGEVVEQRPADTRVFYLATAPSLFAAISENLGAAGLVTPTAGWCWRSRWVAIWPRPTRSTRKSERCSTSTRSTGSITTSARKRCRTSSRCASAMPCSSPLWSRASVRDVQITLAETVGVEGRGEFYDGTGALRDMVQNHLLQLLCIVAMEPLRASTPTPCATKSSGPARLASVHPGRRRHPHGARAVPCRGDRRQAGTGLSRGAGDPRRQPYRDLRRDQGRAQQLALGRRAVLPAHRQAHAGAARQWWSISAKSRMRCSVTVVATACPTGW